MNHDAFRPPAILIPDCWSPEQALATADFLGDIISAIWRAYASDIHRYLQQESSSQPHGSTASHCHDDDIPF
jgi:hypothetical protein